MLTVTRQRGGGMVGCLIMLALLLSSAPVASAAAITIKRPGAREFVRDGADMLSPEDETRIRTLCLKLLKDKATPIIVVTIESMAKHGGAGMTIETFSTVLFNQWGIGHKKLGGQNWNTGILLLISKDDRRARIELGAGWGRSENATSQTIMDDHIVYQFKQGKFSEGIIAGVIGLDKMARKLKLPTRPRPWWHFALVIGVIGLAIFSGVSLYRRGASGWAWVLWAAIFAIVGMILYNALRSSSSGGFGGGSFGGGSSGGGGASGSW